MKATTFLTAILLLTTNLIFGENPVTAGEYYTLSVSYIYSGNGFGAGYSFTGSVIHGRKSLEAGFIYGLRESRISGGDFRYKVFLGNIEKINSGTMRYIPYLQYSLNYQIGTIFTDRIKINNEVYEFPSSPGRVSSIGHYISYGNKIRIHNRLSLESTAGIGAYHGSLDKVKGPGTWGIHYENHGFTFACKVGLSYTLK